MGAVTKEIILQVKGEISDLQKKLSAAQKSFSDIKIDPTIGGKFLRAFADLEKELIGLEASVDKSFQTPQGAKAFEKMLQTIKNSYTDLETELVIVGRTAESSFDKIMPSGVKKYYSDATKAIKDFNSELSKNEKGIKSNEAQTNNLRERIELLEKEKIALQERGDMTAEIAAKEAALAEATKAKVEAQAALNKAQTDVANRKQEQKGQLTKSGELNKRDKTNKALVNELKAAETAAAAAAQQVEVLEQELKQLQEPRSIEDIEKELKDLETQLADTAKSFDENFGSSLTKTFAKAKEAFKQLTGEDYAGFEDLTSFEGFERSINEIERELREFKTKGAQEARQGIQEVTQAVRDSSPAMEELERSTGSLTTELHQMAESEKEIDNLKTSLLQFFSLSNGIEIFKKAIRSAFDSIKELDAAMTETAVVTDFSVGDMWDQLPQYTKAANDLGVTTLGAYETMTLFYQQGLETNAVFEIGTETMKMARIAGLEYTDATNLMTAALRGFNMELSETSAMRVNDVYSELAKITAADTEEIATAMTKTASIANSANMEFETTAALLSQIIETTREAPETAGTALKTIIARFQELKKAPGEIQAIDGEMVDANKIESALKTIGVSLRDTNGQFRDLDDVFLEISQKWNTLDVNTQRYIATMAAGSRQQSRFIAMMQDYDRTMELVEAANDSAGSSQEQYEKTLDSLETKLNKLHNAYNEFVMGLANSDLIKVGVDILTGFLNIANDLTGSIGDVGGAITKLILIIGGLKVGRNIFNSLLAGFRGFNQTAAISGGNAGQNFINNFTREFSKGSKTLSKKAAKLGENLNRAIAEKFKGKDKISLQNILGMVDPASPEAKDLFKKAGTLTNSIGDHITNSLKVEDMSAQGQNLYNELLLGFKNSVQQTGNIESSIKDFKAKIEKAINEGTIQVDKNILEDAFNFDKIEVPPTVLQSVESLNSKLQKASAAGFALASAFSFVSGILRDNEHELGGDIFETLGSSISIASTAAMGFSAIISAVGPAAAASLASIAPWVIGIAAAIALVAGIIKTIKAEKERNAEELRELAQKAREEADAINESLKEYESIYKQYDEGSISKHTYLEETKDLIKELGLESQMVQLLAMDYKDLYKYLLKVQIEKEKEAQKAQAESAQTDYKGKVTDKYGGINLGQNLINIDGKSYSKDFSKILEAAGGYEKTIEIIRKINSSDLHEKAEGFREFLEIVDGEEKLGSDRLRKDLRDKLDAVEEYINESEDIVSSATDTTFKLQDLEGNISSDDVSNWEDYNKYLEEYKVRLKQHYNDIGYIVADEDIEKDAKNFLVGINEVFRNFVVEDAAKENLTKALTDAFGNAEEVNDWIKELEQTGQLSTTANILLDPNFELKSGFSEKGLAQIQKELNTFTSSVEAQNAITISANIAPAISQLKESGTLTDLGEEDLLAFNAVLSAVPGLYNANITAAEEWKLVSTEGLFAQIAYLQDLQTVQTDIAIQKEQEAIADANNYNIAIMQYRALQQEEARLSALRKQGSPEFDSAELENVERQLTEITNVYGDLSNAEPIKFDIDYGAFDKLESYMEGVLSESEKLKEAAEMIGEGYRVSAEEAKALFAIFPELAKNAEGVAGGLIQLDSEIVQTVIGGNQAIVKSDIETSIQLIDNEIALLTAKKSAAEAELNLYKSLKNGELDLEQNQIEILSDARWTLTEYLIQLGLDETNANKAAAAAMSGNMQEYEEITKDVSNNNAYNLALSISDAANNVDTNSEAMYNSIKEVGKAANNAARAIGGMASGTVAGQGGSYKGKGGKFNNTFVAVTAGGAFTGADPYEITAQKPALDLKIEEIELDLSEFESKINELTGQRALLSANLTSLEETIKGAGKGTGTGSGGDSSAKDWLNDANFDGLYNLVADIEEVARRIKKLEEERERLLTDENATAEEIQKNLDALQEATIKQQEYSAQLALYRAAELELLLQDNQKYSKYATYNFDDDTVEIDVKAIGEIADKEVLEAVQNYISSLETAAKNYKDAVDSLDEIINKEYTRDVTEADLILNRIEILQQRRNQLQEEYNDLLADEEANAAALVENRKAQRELLEAEKEQLEKHLEYQEAFLEKQMVKLEGELGTFFNVFEDGAIELNYEKYSAIDSTDPIIDSIDGIWNTISQTQGKISSITGEINDVERAVKNIDMPDYSAMASLEQQVYDALIEQEEAAIEARKEQVEAMDEAADKMLDGIRKAIDKARQDRENAEREKNLEELQRKLAYLQLDTSNANALAIMETEQELEEARQEYSDSLVDQHLQQLEEQNEEAKEQRQKMLDRLDEQLENLRNSRAIWAQVQEVINSSIGEDGKLISGSALQTIIMNTEEFKTASPSQQQQILNDLNSSAETYANETSKANQLEVIGETSRNGLTFSVSNQGTFTNGRVDADGNVYITYNGEEYKFTEVFKQADGTYHTYETLESAKITPTDGGKPVSNYIPPETNNANTNANNSNNNNQSNNAPATPALGVGSKINAGSAKIYTDSYGGGAQNQYYKNDPVYIIKGENNGYWRVAHHTNPNSIVGWFKKSDVKAYKTGGLVDSTGLAWLDGTKSKPEIVLNAQDSANFLQLKNILSRIFSGPTSSENVHGGDNYYEIEINVEKIDNDYDVEQIADKIKSMITNDSMYRNVNAINMLR